MSEHLPAESNDHQIVAQPRAYCQCGCGGQTKLVEKGRDRGTPRRYIKGHHPRAGRPPRTREQVEHDFWSRVDRSGECWLWNGAVNKKTGYGIAVYGGRTTTAHRIAYIIMHGEIEPDIEVCHNCPGGDNRLCVCPDHMFLGTRQENMADMYEKRKRSKAL